MSPNKKFERVSIYNKTPSGSGVTGGEGKVNRLPMKRQDSKSTLSYGQVVYHSLCVIAFAPNLGDDVTLNVDTLYTLWHILTEINKL